MPQMSPVMWFVFPFIMMMLVLVGVVFLNNSFGEVKSIEWGCGSMVKNLKW